MSEKIKSIFDRDEFKPYKTEWENRVAELNRRDSYYDGSVYKQSTLKTFFRAIPQVAGQIKPIYLFLSRAVDVDAGIVPAGWTFPEGSPPAWEQGRDQVFAWSKWKTKGPLFVDYGARLGLSGLRVADVPDEGKVVIQPVDPRSFMLVRPGQYSEAVEMSIYIDDRQDVDGEVFEYAEVINSETVRTFKDGEPWIFDDERESAEWKNELGFVPFVEVKFKENGKGLSEATFERQIPALDELNELASDLAEVLDENKDPQVVIVGAEASDLVRGKNTVWFLPEGARVEMIVPGINIEGTLKFIQDIKVELKESLPELSFDSIKDASQIATETLETKLTELVLKIKRIRPNFDDGLALALRMAARVAEITGVDGLEGLDDDELEFDQEREILPMDPEKLIDLDLKRLARDQAEALTRAPVSENPGVVDVNVEA